MCKKCDNIKGNPFRKTFIIIVEPKGGSRVFSMLGHFFDIFLGRQKCFSELPHITIKTIF